MLLSENTLRQIITGAQVTNRALKTATENAYNTIPNANFQLVTDNILLKLYADKHFESRKRTFNVFQGLYWDPEQISNCNSSITGRVSTLTSSLGGDYDDDFYIYSFYRTSSHIITT